MKLYLLIAAIIILMIVVATYSVKGQRRRQCQQWQEWNQSFPQFSPSGWQKIYCEKINITI